MSATPGIDWVGILAPFASGAFGVGMAYGLIKAKIDATIDRLSRAEGILDKQVGDIRCREYREMCRKEWKEDVARIEHKAESHGNKDTRS